MKIEIIAVGDEAQYRNHFDTAYEYLKKETASVKAEITDYHILPGEAAELFTLLKESTSVCDAVLLLVTPDAGAVRTVLKVICSGMETESTIDPDLEKQIAARAAREGANYTYEELEAFASFPKGSRELLNRSGLVQGYAITAKKQLLFVLPVIPSELATLFASEVRPTLASFSGVAASYGMVRALEIDSFSVQQVIDDLNQDQRLHVSAQSNSGDYEIYIEATGATQEDADRLKENAIQRLKEKFGIYLYCIGNQTLPAIVVDQMAVNGLTLASAEMGTGTLLKKQLSAAWGADNFYPAAYGRENILGEMHLPKKLLQESGECSPALASALAVQSRREGKTAIGIGICCRHVSAENSTSSRSQIFAAIADKGRVWHKRLELSSAYSEKQMAQMAVWQALNMVRLYAAEYPKPLPGGTPADSVEHSLAGLAGLPALFAHGKKNDPNASPETGTAGAGDDKINAKEKGNMRSTLSKSAAHASGTSAEGGTAAKKTTLIQRIKTKQLTKNDKIRLIALGFCALVFIGCIAYIVSVKLESIRNAKQSADLAGLYGENISVPGYPSNYIHGFEALWQINPDIAGWITIPDTDLNYAVVQTGNNTDYDRVDFYKKKNQHGIPYVDYRVNLQAPSFNTIIYSHNMNDGQMFGLLTNYKKLSYYQQHPTVTFNSVYRKNDYKIFAVVVCKANDDEFSYHNFIDSDNAADRDQYLNKILERSIINTTVDVKNTDKILTMSTCDYSFRDPQTNKLIARFVVFARAIRDGESSTVNTDGASLNPNPVIPKEWGEYIQKLQDKKAANQAETEQKAFIDLWLTSAEKTGTTAEQYARAQERANLASQYLTGSELNSGMSPNQIQQTINTRQALFNAMLSGSEQSLSVSNKISLANERNSALKQYFSEGEIQSMGSGAVIDRYSLLSSGEKVSLYLSQAEIRDTSASASDQLATIAQRKQDASQYLTQEQINSCTSFTQLQNKMNEAINTRKTYEQQALAAGISQSEIDSMTLAQLVAAVNSKQNDAKKQSTIDAIKAINPNATGSNGQALTDMSQSELDALLSQLKSSQSSTHTSLLAKAKSVGMTDAEIASCATDKQLEDAIAKKTATSGSATGENGGTQSGTDSGGNTNINL